MLTTKERIQKILENNQKLRPAELVEELGVSRQLVQEKLGELVNEGKVTKIGSSPLVFYQIKDSAVNKDTTLSDEQNKFLEKNYLYVAPNGIMEWGAAGLRDWALKSGQRQDWQSLVKDYIKTRKRADHFLKDGQIDGTDKIATTFPETHLDKVFFSDFYSLPRFGKTRLGQMMFYAKQSQNTDIMRRIAIEILPTVQKIIYDQQITEIAFVPPSIPRKIQFLARLKRDLDLRIPEVSLEKTYSGEIKIAQKTLKTLSERVDNARNTIIVGQKNLGNIRGENILLIDDALGSGATFNEVAHKLKALGATKVIGYAITGSMNGFDVIKEA